MGEQHSAAGPMGGYLWQLRKALLHLLSLDEGQAVTIERHDDICVVEVAGELLTAIQAKHSLAADGKLAVRSPELWKTLRVWSGLAQRTQLPRALVLATTSSPSAELAPLATTVKPSSWPSGLVQHLTEIAQEAGNKSLRSCYEAWRSLNAKQHAALIERAKVVLSPPLADLTHSLQNAIKQHHIPMHDVERVTRAVEGWFMSTVSERLTTSGCELRYDDVWEVIDEHHRGYRAVATPPEPEDAEDVVQELVRSLADTRATFIRQLKLIDAQDSQVENAVRFYSRARVARSKWLEQAAVARKQITRYVAELYDHWDSESAAAVREINSHDDTECISAGWTVHDACMRHQAPFGTTTAPKYLTVGSYHLLADEQRVGWHPLYTALLNGDHGDP